MSLLLHQIINLDRDYSSIIIGTDSQ